MDGAFENTRKSASDAVVSVRGSEMLFAFGSLAEVRGQSEEQST